jgi:hypothetical protein
MNTDGYTLFFDNPALTITALCIKVGETPTTGLNAKNYLSINWYHQWLRYFPKDSMIKLQALQRC